MQTKNTIFFVRATTPSYSITLTDTDGNTLDPSEYADIKITIKQYEHTLISKSTKSGTATIEGDSIHFSLSQEETLRFQPGEAYIQPHLLSKDGQAYADKDMQTITVYDILDGGTI